MQSNNAKLSKNIVILISFLISFLLTTACGAMAAVSSGVPEIGPVALGAGETIKGMQAAMQSAPGSFIMANGEQLLFVWPKGQNYALAALNAGSADQLIGASRAGAVTLTEYVKALESGGWRIIQPAAVPAGIAQALTAYSVEMAITALQGLPTVFMLPVSPVMLTPGAVINNQPVDL